MSAQASRYSRSAAQFGGKVSSMAGCMVITFLLTGSLRTAIYYGLPVLSGMEEPLARLIFALKCMCVATLLCFLTGIEAVSHERVQTAAFDPLAGHDSE